jgi:hypothetical protein
MRISGFLAVQQAIQNEHCPVSLRKESYYVTQTLYITETTTKLHGTYSQGVKKSNCNR